MAPLLFALGCGGGDGELPEQDAVSARNTAQGALIGFRSRDGAQVWRGIPYAQPPVGDLRWRAPRPPEPWQDVRDARAFGPACAQHAGAIGRAPGLENREDGVFGSEDCLTLNIYGPRLEPGELPTGFWRLPVMVWFHGGGNTAGTAASYDASMLAFRYDLLVVTVNYRLGVFGWLSHPSLAGPDGNADDRSGNFGLLDQIRALEWVRDNIGDFGGNPDKVTIFGESAGGRDVIALLASPRAKGLFHQAIVQSGGTATVPPAEARNFRDDPDSPGATTSSGELLLALLQAQGRAESRDAAKVVLAGMPPEAVAELLRAQPDTALLDFYPGDPVTGMYRIPQMFRDGHVLPAESILETFREVGAASPVPVIFGSNRDEDKLFMVSTSDAVARVLGVPLWFRDRRLYDLLAEYRSLAWKARGVDEPAAALRSHQGPIVYAYRFDWDEEPRVAWLDLSALLGAAHMLEIPFAFGSLELLGAERVLFSGDGRPGAETLAAQMSGYWAEFAARGSPGRGRSYEVVLPYWQPWNPTAVDSLRYMVFDSAAGGGLRMASEAVTTASIVERAASDPRFRDERERCAFYADLAAHSEEYGPEQYAAGPCAEFPLPQGS